MRPATIKTSSVLLLLTPVLATTNQDLVSLQNSCQNVTTILTDSLNDTAALNTADLLQTIVYQIGASLANAGCIGTTVPLPSDQGTLDDVYLNYTGSLSNLASAAIDRGRSMHQEMNEPVAAALASLANAVYAYGICLYNGDRITQPASIRTWRAGSDVVEAESAWNDVLNYPGRRLRRRDDGNQRTVRGWSTPRKPGR